MSNSSDIFINDSSCSQIPAAQQLRQNVLNYLERERPFRYDEIRSSPSYSPIPAASRERPFQFEERPSSSGPERVPNSKKRGTKTLYSYIKKPAKGLQSKVIRIQIYDAEDLKSSKLCECRANVCAQHIVENVFNDDIYKCAKDMISKIQKKL
ncbi:uncharacterized protein LOC124641649 [Helicoverpa zea]|uniref:uncharacterized protein LOC124641649 n=1 Tax=Helicoverpa zea TaxID=7113 RepID=UPI001F56F22C|nr:uncharacterized protein LOC124641649 [Helicoverpa zea]